MRDYQREKNNKYYLPKSLYKRVLAVIRDYDRQRQSHDEIIFGGGNTNIGMPHSTAVGNPTEQKGMRLAQIDDDICAIDAALRQIPSEYATYIFDNIRYGYNYPSWVQNKDKANKATWSRQRMKFIYFVAKNLKLL